MWIVMMIDRGTPRPVEASHRQSRTDIEQRIEQACRAKAGEALVAPASARWSDDARFERPETAYFRMHTFVDAENRSHMMIRSQVTCVVDAVAGAEDIDAGSAALFMSKPEILDY